MKSSTPNSLQHFIPGVARDRTRHDLPPDEPAILFMDGHLSHESADLLEELRQNHIDVVEFYPHASHVQQPLDGGIYRSWRSGLRKVTTFTLPS